MALRAARQQGVEPDQQKILNGTFHSIASRFFAGVQNCFIMKISSASWTHPIHET